MMDITIQPKFSYYNLFTSFFRNSAQINSTDYLFNSGRSSLFTLLNHEHKSIKRVLLPELICDDVTDIITRLNIPIVYYPIDDRLDPNIDFISDNIINDHSILIVPNYFGSASNWDDILKLKNHYSITIVEDNAHSLFGRYNNQEFGTIGDISFNSLRKILPTLGGSVLKFNNEQPQNIKISKRLPNIDEIKISLSSLKPRYFRNYNPIVNTIGNSLSSIDFIDIFSNYIYNKTCKEMISNIRRENYKFWHNYLKNIDIEPIKLRDPTCPYVYPCYVKNSIEIDRFVQWGKMNNISIINWPKLPNDVNLHQSKLSKIICFPVNHLYKLNQIKTLNELH